MKVIWETQDIQPGTRYSKHGIKEVWIIGYLANAEGPCRYVSASLVDGMVTSPLPQWELAEELTRSEYLPLELIDQPKG